MRKFISALSLFILFALVANAALAIEGNTRKGKFLYRKNCRSCHGVSASDLSPSSKKQAEWLKVYSAQGAVPCSKDWPTLSEQEKNDIFAYLHEFGADSPTPAKCE